MALVESNVDLIEIACLIWNVKKAFVYLVSSVTIQEDVRARMSFVFMGSVMFLNMYVQMDKVVLEVTFA